MWNNDPEQRYSEEELKAELAALFPQGWCGADVLAEIAPDGWEQSPFVRLYHPTVEQQYEEAVRMHRNLASLPFGKKDENAPPRPEPTLEEIQAEHEPSPVDGPRECQEIVGQCLWDIFSDNHDVIADDGRVLTMGSSRASGEFLAEVLNAQGGPPPLPRPELPAELMTMFAPPPGASPEVLAMIAQMRKSMIGDGDYTYLDFYMGTIRIADRADLTPIYEMIFRRLKARGHVWKYSFPRLYLADMRPIKKALDEQSRGDEAEYEGYNPSASFEAEQEEREHDEKTAELREKLDEDYRDAVEAAQDQAPPKIVLAYENVYGEYPQGWPPEVE